MGKRGPAPKPTATKRALGNPGRRPLNDREPQLPIAEPTMPSWISREAKAEWKKIVPYLLAMRVLTEADGAALVGYCQAWAEIQICTRALNQDGRFPKEPVVDRDGNVLGCKVRAHPAIRAQRDAFARLKSYLALFGLSPSDRSSVIAQDDRAGDIDPLQQLINRSGRDS